MFGAILRIFRTPDLRRKIGFTLGIIALFRLGSFIPTPFIDYTHVQICLGNNAGTTGLYDLVNLFSGGALLQLSIFALGIMPYITASIIVQLLRVVIPHFDTLYKEGQAGQAKLTQYTRYLTIGLAILQSTTLVTVARSGALFPSSTGTPECSQLLSNDSWYAILLMVITMTAGTGLIMWMGELITERGIGNGISLIIMAGIVAELPTAIANTLELGRQGALSTVVILAILIMAVVVIAVIVFVERAQRRLLIQYPKRQVGNRMFEGQSSHLPLKLNTSGVIPPIFASSLLLLPTTIASFNAGKGPEWFQWLTTQLGHGRPLFLILYLALIVFFTFFYTAIVFNPTETADNLKKHGGFIPGIRPGERTAEYIDYVLSRITVIGAIYLAAVCLVPEILISYASVPFYLGGTSLLIVVSVTMDTVAQVQGYMLAHQYEGLIRKSKLRGRRK